MQSIVLREESGERTLGVADVSTPETGCGEIRLDIRKVGICGSDVGAWQGKPAYDFLETPRILGHEYVGVVDAVGEDVESVAVGDRVVERPLRSCGVCPACRNGAEHVCENLEITGFHADGAFAEYTVISADRAHPVPDSIPDRLAAVTEPMAVAARATLERTSLSAGDDVFVLGAGPMGTFSAIVADYSGANVVVGGLSTDEPRFEILGQIGIATANLESTSLADVAQSATDGVFDVLVDATGSTAALESNIDVLRRGGEAVVIGIPTGTVDLPTPSFVRKEQQVSASYGAKSKDFEKALDVLAGTGPNVDGTLRLYVGTAAPSAFQNFYAGDDIKPILDATDFS